VIVVDSIVVLLVVVDVVVIKEVVVIIEVVEVSGVVTTEVVEVVFSKDSDKFSVLFNVLFPMKKPVNLKSIPRGLIIKSSMIKVPSPNPREKSIRVIRTNQSPPIFNYLKIETYFLFNIIIKKFNSVKIYSSLKR
jgi:hypothetical protein